MGIENKSILSGSGQVRKSSDALPTYLPGADWAYNNPREAAEDKIRADENLKAVIAKLQAGHSVTYEELLACIPKEVRLNDNYKADFPPELGI